MAESHVVVFPSAFARNKTALLVGNIKKALDASGRGYGRISRDGPLIIVDADDPVLASHTIGLLFGIERVAIAKRTGNNFEEIKSEITRIGSNLLLAGDIFYVQVEGEVRGFLPGDLEAAATSSIIEKSHDTGARPGTKTNHDRLFYSYLTKSHGYVCIFTEKGPGGVPYGARGMILCPIFDGLSAVSCVESVRCGFDVRIIILYKKDSELPRLAKMISRIIPKTAKKNIEMRFFKLGTGKHHAHLKTILKVIEAVATEEKINRVSLPVTPLIHTSEVIDEFVLGFAKRGIVAYISLGSEDEMYVAAREIGLEKFAPGTGRMSNLGRIDEKIIRAILQTSKSITVRAGPNNVHDILDGLADGGADT